MNLRIGNYDLHSAEPQDDDSRGLVHVWEQPRQNASYVVACDPSYGIAGWDRSLRTEDDLSTDNCAVQVLRCGNPNVQVAEYAAPIDAEDAARVVNFLGRMYGGSNDEGEALAIIEVQPGPGLLTQRELINHYGYTNLFLWEHLDKLVTTQTPYYGWYSSRQSRQMLWIRGTRHINSGKVIINSPWLVEEMTDLVQDNFLSFTSRAQWGSHDDRMVAFLLGIWAANRWNFENAPEEAAKPELVGGPDYQATDCSYEDMLSSWDDRLSSMLGE